MIKTILLGSCTFVQGTFVRKLDDGKIVVRVGDRVFQGVPVTSSAAARLKATTARLEKGAIIVAPFSLSFAMRDHSSVRSTSSRSKISITSPLRMSS